MGYASRATYPLVAITTTTLVVVLDLMTKTRWFGYEPRWTRLAPLLQTIDHHNYGLIFDIPAPTWLIVLVSAAVLIGVAAIFRAKILRSAWVAFAFGLLAGGAIGNGYDRIALGFVRDWILVFGRSALNVADLSIAVGLLLLAWQEYGWVDENSEVH